MSPLHLKTQQHCLEIFYEFNLKVYYKNFIRYKNLRYFKFSKSPSLCVAY
jgi:hypothetical protein